MLIDWFTVGAQVLNFLVLIWLLKRFLYQPILDAIDAREQRIARELAQADAQKAEAQQAHATFMQKNLAFDQERAALLQEATQAAQAERQRLLEAARQEAKALSAKYQDSLQNEAKALHQVLQLRTQQEVFAIARKALSDMANAPLEEQMVAVFMARLQALSDADQQALRASFQSATAPLILRSTFALPPSLQTPLATRIQELLSTQAAIRFETAPELVCGIELCSEGYKVAWSIAEYLQALENSIAECLPATAAPAPAGKDAPHAH